MNCTDTRKNRVEGMYPCKEKDACKKCIANIEKVGNQRKTKKKVELLT